MRPIFHMFFRPEEVHTASSLAPGYFSRQTLSEGDIHMSHDRRWIGFQDILALQADEDGLPTIQATGVDTDLSTRIKPAHGCRFESSLAVPLLVPLYSHKIMGRYIRKRRPRLDVICVFNKPASYRGIGCLMLQLPGLFRSQAESCCKFGIVWCPPSFHKMLHNSSVSSLHQCGFFHIISSLPMLVTCDSKAVNQLKNRTKTAGTSKGKSAVLWRLHMTIFWYPHPLILPPSSIITIQKKILWQSVVKAKIQDNLTISK
jgi:hypothetical protein